MSFKSPLPKQEKQWDKTCFTLLAHSPSLESWGCSLLKDPRISIVRGSFVQLLTLFPFIHLEIPSFHICRPQQGWKWTHPIKNLSWIWTLLVPKQLLANYSESGTWCSWQTEEGKGKQFTINKQNAIFLEIICIGNNCFGFMRQIFPPTWFSIHSTKVL